MLAGTEGKKSLPDLLRAAIELCMPNMRHYYRVTRKAKVVASYASDGRYYADVQPLRNDETEDEAEPVVPKVEIPILWAGPKRGVVCPPAEGTFCDLSYYDGDPNYPRISNFRWHDMDAPEAELNEFVIQLEPGVEIRIDREKHIVTLTPENVRTEAGKDIDGTAGINWTIQAGQNAAITAGKDATITAGNDATITAGNNATITAGNEATMEAGSIANIVAPLINLCGRIICRPWQGIGRGYAEFEGDVVIRGNEEVRGNTDTWGANTVGGSQAVGGDNTIGGCNTVRGDSSTAGDSYAGTRSGGTCPH